MKQINNGDELLNVLEALSNPYRLKIISILFNKRTYVSQLARELAISRPLLYLHLKKLEEAGLVTGQHEVATDGKTMKYYELNTFHIPLDEQFITQMSSSLTVKPKKERGE
ncbi:ArsR/SmtB family transcription factor [Alkalihalobacillus hemicellulosilyticus]|uniref:Regulatory protein n=1 Tax=Halalkalibacter hemicellulosilyticusJCM 9152 TaxID=1236971 RepID=W4QC87_9BACI|nr:winged helix-turn-helix domain-containing protein [Halalkalibacter hemicellulosilyticus]GAE29645.1 regulatory protein [Halalkalibacter hemicellulosilyticusJCM 9152]